MSDYQERALEKLEKEYKAGSYDRYAQIMKEGVKNALTDFINQDEEFAQAVVQGGSFESCMKAVAKSCGSGLSDLTAYQRAVQFYFPGAKIRFTMTIDLIGDAAGQKEEPVKGVILDLYQLL